MTIENACKKVSGRYDSQASIEYFEKNIAKIVEFVKRKNYRRFFIRSLPISFFDIRDGLSRIRTAVASPYPDSRPRQAETGSAAGTASDARGSERPVRRRPGYRNAADDSIRHFPQSDCIFRPAPYPASDSRFTALTPPSTGLRQAVRQACRQRQKPTRKALPDTQSYAFAIHRRSTRRTFPGPRIQGFAVTRTRSKPQSVTSEPRSRES